MHNNRTYGNSNFNSTAFPCSLHATIRILELPYVRLFLFFFQEKNDWNELGERQQRRRMTEGKAALEDVNGPKGLPEFASALAEKLSGNPAAATLGEILSANVMATVKEVKGSATTQGLAARLTEGLTTLQAAKVTGLSERTIQLARAARRKSEPHDAKWKQHPPLRRKAMSDEEEKATGEWQKCMCPAKSGSPYHMQWVTSLDLYESYVDAINTGKIQWQGQKKVQARGRILFDRLKKKMKIRTAKTYDGMFNCMRCAALAAEEANHEALDRRWKAAKAESKKPEDDTVLNDEMDASLKRLRALREHRVLRDHQHAYLMQCRHETIQAHRKRVLVVMDFSKYFYQRNVTMDNEMKKGTEEYIHDMVMVIECWPEEEKQLAPAEGKEEKKEEEKKEEKKQRGRRKKRKAPPRRWVRYIDNLCERAGTAGNDTCYVREAMRDAIKKGMFDGFERVDLFSDGGPKHYKSVYAMRMMADWYDWWDELRPGVVIPELWWNFTAPYHGHGVADSHAGIISQMLCRRQKGGQGTWYGVGGGPANATEIAAMVAEMKNTVPVVFNKIERPEYRTDLWPLETIKKHFQFRFKRETTITINDSKEETVTNKTVVQFRLRSSDKEDVKDDPWKEQGFAEKQTESRTLARKRKVRDIRVKVEPGLSLSSSDSAAIDGNRERAIKLQAMGSEISTKPTRAKAKGKATAKAIPKASSKGKGQSQGKKPKMVEEEEMDEQVGEGFVPLSRGAKMMLAAAAAAVTTKSGRTVKASKKK
jgi:hypothetical protein